MEKVLHFLSVNRQRTPLSTPLQPILDLSIVPYGTQAKNQRFWSIDIMLNSTVRGITSYRRDLLVNDPENLHNYSHIPFNPNLMQNNSNRKANIWYKVIFYMINCTL